MFLNSEGTIWGINKDEFSKIPGCPNLNVTKTRLIPLDDCSDPNCTTDCKKTYSCSYYSSCSDEGYYYSIEWWNRLDQTNPYWKPKEGETEEEKTERLSKLETAKENSKIYKNFIKFYKTESKTSGGEHIISKDPISNEHYEIKDNQKICVDSEKYTCIDPNDDDPCIPDATDCAGCSPGWVNSATGCISCDADEDGFYKDIMGCSNDKPTDPDDDNCCAVPAGQTPPVTCSCNTGELPVCNGFKYGVSMKDIRSSSYAYPPPNMFQIGNMVSRSNVFFKV